MSASVSLETAMAHASPRLVTNKKNKCEWAAQFLEGRQRVIQGVVAQDPLLHDQITIRLNRTTQKVTATGLLPHAVEADLLLREKLDVEPDFFRPMLLNELDVQTIDQDEVAAHASAKNLIAGYTIKYADQLADLAPLSITALIELLKKNGIYVTYVDTANNTIVGYGAQSTGTNLHDFTLKNIPLKYVPLTQRSKLSFFTELHSVVRVMGNTLGKAFVGELIREANSYSLVRGTVIVPKLPNQDLSGMQERWLSAAGADEVIPLDWKFFDSSYSNKYQVYSVSGPRAAWRWILQFPGLILAFDSRKEAAILPETFTKLESYPKHMASIELHSAMARRRQYLGRGEDLATIIKAAIDFFNSRNDKELEIRNLTPHSRQEGMNLEVFGQADLIQKFLEHAHLPQGIEVQRTY
jgi:hypothetical protein